MTNFMESFKPKWNSFRESMYLLAKNKLSLLALIVLVVLVAMAVYIGKTRLIDNFSWQLPRSR